MTNEKSTVPRRSLGREHSKFLHVQVARGGITANIELNRALFAAVPRILTTIEADKEGRTKHCVPVLLCTFLKILSQRQDFQDWCFMWFTCNWNLKLYQPIGADTNHMDFKFLTELGFNQKLQLISSKVPFLACCVESTLSSARFPLFKAETFLRSALFGNVCSYPKESPLMSGFGKSIFLCETPPCEN